MTKRVRRLLRRRPGFSALIVSATLALLGASAALVATRLGPAAASASPQHRATFDLVSSIPSSGTTDVSPDSALSLEFSSPVGSVHQDPTLTPAISGSWVQNSSDTLTFVASQSLPPGQTEQLSVPGGPGGIDGANGAHLSRTATLSFSVAPMPAMRVQQLLAQLGYLPLTFTPTTPTPAANEMGVVQAGSFSWRWTTLPQNFTSLWTPGQPNVITTGAVMAFESQHNLATDGVAGPQVWSSLLTAASENQADTFGHYDFVEVSTSLPEHVDVWQDGAVAYSTPANTGIEAAPTERGTWPVYVRYTSTTMSGTNPDGSHYSDPGVPWVSYFHGGDALHGFIRSSYGTPQSLGCVEMPPSNAQIVYPYTPLGTLVTVT